MNVIEIFAKFIVDTNDLDKGLNEAEKKAEGVGGKVGGALSGIGKGLLGLGAAGAAAVGATTTATVALAKQATDAYGEFQQLQGGIQTLFSDTTAISNYRAELEAIGMTEDEINQKMADYKDPISERVMENAANAYKTAGMSANDYMNTVIGMAASLNKATGDTEESARLADLAITDMSDNVNKMGTSMEMVQNAYRGFTRGNFTMLDNLALGFAGTKEGMQELLDSAEQISGIKYDINSYADIVNAIHVVQTQMGITGTTAKEAGDTITGSAGAMKAAWDNLVLGIARPGSDLGALITNVVASAEVALKNIMPIFSQALNGIGELLKSVAPIISRELPGLIDSILPQVLDAAMSLMTGIRVALPELITIITDQTPLFVEAVRMILDSIVEVLPSLLKALTNAIPPLIQAIADIMVTNAPTLVQAAVDLIVQLTNAVADMLPMLIDQFVDVVSQIAIVLTRPNNIRAIIQAGVKLITALASGLWNNRKKVFDTMRQVAKALTEALIQEFPRFKGIFESIQKVIDGVFGFVEKHGPTIESVLKGILAGFIAYKAVTGVFEAIHGAITAVQTAMTVMNGLMEAAALINPYTAIAVAIGAVVGVMGTLISMEQAEQEAYLLSLTTLSEENQKRLDSANEYIGKLDEMYGKNMDIAQSVDEQFEPEQNLLDELNLIVDANGRIKKGYEERAEVITGQLSEAFGIEIQTQDGVILKYDEVMAKIDEVIAKKKADALLTANQEEYSNALRDQVQLYNEMVAVQEEYAGYESTRDFATMQLEKAQTAMSKLSAEQKANSLEADEYRQTIEMMSTAINENNLKMQTLESTLTSTQEAYYKNQDFISDYNSLLDASAGKTDDLGKAVENMTNGIVQNAPDRILKKQATDAIKYLDSLVQSHKNGVQISERQIEEATQKAQAAIEALESAGSDGVAGYSNAFKDSSDLIKNAEDMVDAGLKAVAEAQDSNSPSKEYEKLGKDAMDGYILGIQDKEPSIFSEFDGMVNDAADIFSDLIDKAWDWGSDLIGTFTSGISQALPRLTSKIGDVAKGIKSYIHFSEPDVGPLADFSSYAPDMMETFAKGITDNTAVVMDAVSKAFDFGGQISGGMPGVTGGLLKPTATQPITVVLELDGQQFGKAVFNANLAESQRIGVDLGRKEIAYS